MKAEAFIIVYIGHHKKSILKSMNLLKGKSTLKRSRFNESSPRLENGETSVDRTTMDV